ncbi:hypothetical protein NPIL_685321 [Nephila pilipes]|uniref:Uncharacterized protein n=1 Tax=Nephila pilipes TaxID=299642 RepID=A0A8X6QG72_NEPPI|nr:hypothetical protein NPIL_685321 [Nephila pilipes]
MLQGSSTCGHTAMTAEASSAAFYWQANAILLACASAQFSLLAGQMRHRVRAFAKATRNSQVLLPGGEKGFAAAFRHGVSGVKCGATKAYAAR